MLSSEVRCLYRRNQLVEVICQLRFPEILSIGTQVPDAFQEAIRDAFPQYRRLQENLPPKVSNSGGQFTLEKQTAAVNHQFADSQGIWRINLTSRFISLSCSRYHSWEEFAKKLDRPLAAFIRIYQPAYFERVGLRHLNFISRKDLQLEDVPFRELINSCYLGPLALEHVVEQSVTRCNVDLEFALRGGCRAKLHAGPGMVKRNGQNDPEVKFVWDQDLFLPGQLPVNLSAGALQTLHSQAYALFRGAITQKLHEALEPQDL
jgi:uncharacterized protein (TIGR04255 family)